MTITLSEIAVAFGMFLASASFLVQVFSSNRRNTKNLDRTTDHIIVVGVLIMFIGLVTAL
jgi:lipid-A-disaccharide synthase-like uncharacterized protein